MGFKYTRPRGAYADAKELEYVSALHQTGRNELRKDGSIRAADVTHYLMSRHGITVTEEEVGERIMGAFGERSWRSEYYERSDAPFGDGGEDRGDHLDLTQVLALLLVPLLVKAERDLSGLSSIPRASSYREGGGASVATGATTRPSFAVRRHTEIGDKRWPDADLIENVLRMIMHDATGDPNPRPLTRDLVRQILYFYGEGGAADDERLVDEMLAGASANALESAGTESDVEGGPILLDQHVFARALTHDVQQYSIERENEVTANYYDVLRTREGEKKEFFSMLSNQRKIVDADGDGKDGETASRPVQTVFTFPTIDYTADTFRSKGFVTLLWVTWILTYVSYLYSRNVLALAQLKCDHTHFGCAIVQGITNWLTIMVQLSVLGTTFIIWASMGNVHKSRPIWIVLGMCAVVLFVLLPYFHSFSSEVFSTEKSGDVPSQLLYHLSVICGFILLSDSLLNLFRRILPEKLPEFTEALLAPGVRLEAQIKRAASFKVNQLVRNACDVHRTAELDGGISGGAGETKYGKAMLAFARSSDLRGEFGGILPTWRMIWNGQLFEEDGIWFTTHLLAGNVAQCTLCLLLGAVFVAFYKSETFHDGLDYLAGLPQGPQRWRLMLPLFFGLICGEVAIITIVANYIPSTVNTILQYRTGGYESLHSKKFLKLRFAVDSSSLLFGSIFWGTLYTSVAIGSFTMIVLGIIMWPEFAQVVLLLFANIVGICITILLKWLVLIGYRRKYIKAYYRRSVGLTNFVGVILESWNLSLTSSYMILRSLKLTISAILYIGRVDIPLLSEDACFLGPFELDAYPLIFRRDILVHEAHRHPYLERLGVMYMMKLRHDGFGNYAGTCWRLLFIYALVPWMRKYRNRDGSLDISDFKFAANRMWTGRMPAESAFDEKLFSPALKEATASNKIDSKEAEDAITALRHQNKLLKKENEMMRSLLFRNKPSGAGMLKSCPPKIFSDSLPTDPLLSTRTL